MPTGPAARTTDNVVHPLPPVLSPGPGSTNVIIGYLPAWRGMPLAAVAALQAAKTTSDAAINTAVAATAAAAGTPALPAAKAAEEATKAAALSSMSSAISSASAGADIHMCATPLPIPPHGPGVVIDGSSTVMINNLPACRMGDTILEAIGPPNKIAKGEMSVIIGDSGSGRGAGAGGAGGGLGSTKAESLFATLSNVAKDIYHSLFGERYSDGIVIKGDKEFREKAKADLDKIKATESGKKLLDSIDSSGKTVTIVESDKGNSEDADSFKNGLMGKDGKPGPGTDSTVKFNPDKTSVGDGSEPWMNRPASVGLAHEMIHAAHDANGTTEYDHSNPKKRPQNYETQTVGLKDTKDGKNVDYSGNDYTENKIRDEMGEPQRPNY